MSKQDVYIPSEIVKECGFNELIPFEDSSDTNTDDSELYIFVSFDLSNSTTLKYNNIYWFDVIKNLLNEKFNGTGFWKFNGDEIIFKYPIISISSIVEIITKSYRKLKQLKRTLSSNTFDINIKTTIWLARIDNSENDMYNKKIKIGDTEEFIGINIDEGFRLTKNAAIQKIVLDPKIVYLLLLTKDIAERSNRSYSKEDKFALKVQNAVEFQSNTIIDINELITNIHFAGFAKCKGVWSNNPYPIFWYYDDSNAKMHYNEFFNGEHIWDKEYKPIDNTYIERLQEIFKTVKVYDELLRIIEIIDVNGVVDKPLDNRPNLYYMVVCQNPVSRKMLIAQRSATRTHLKNVWDFGNVKYQNTKVVETIKQEYKNTFGIEIELELDPVRKNIKTFGYCTIYRNCYPHNCLLCYATIKNDNNLSDKDLIRVIQNHVDSISGAKKKYQNIKFVSSNEVNDLNPLTLDEIREDSELNDDAPSKLGENRCTMYFQESIKEAEIYFSKVK